MEFSWNWRYNVSGWISFCTKSSPVARPMDSPLNIGPAIYASQKEGHALDGILLFSSISFCIRLMAPSSSQHIFGIRSKVCCTSSLNLHTFSKSLGRILLPFCLFLLCIGY